MDSIVPRLEFPVGIVIRSNQEPPFRALILPTWRIQERNKMNAERKQEFGDEGILLEEMERVSIPDPVPLFFLHYWKKWVKVSFTAFHLLSLLLSSSFIWPFIILIVVEDAESTPPITNLRLSIPSLFYFHTFGQVKFKENNEINEIISASRAHLFLICNYFFYFKSFVSPFPKRKCFRQVKW